MSKSGQERQAGQQTQIIAHDHTLGACTCGHVQLGLVGAHSDSARPTQQTQGVVRMGGGCRHWKS